MLWRHLCLVRAWSAGLVGGLLILATATATAQTKRPADSENTAPPPAVVTETVDLLQANTAGQLNVVARGQGQDRVRLSIRNTSGKRLNVVIPPGLVASAAASQGPGGPGGRGGGGFQSMGLGMFSNRPGSFGMFQGSNSSGFQSVPVNDPSRVPAVTVPAGESIDLAVPAVCLNFGLPTPTFRNVFTLMDVEKYSSDPRVSKSLRSLCLLGTSHGVAQAVMWRVCNDLPFETMAAEAGKIMNLAEIALASHFVEALGAATDSEPVDSASLAEGRLFVRIQGEGALARDAKRLNDQIPNYRLLGLPVRALENGELPAAAAPALYVRVILTDSKIGETRGQIQVSSCLMPDQWTPLGKTSFHDTSSLTVLDGETMARSLDRALAAAFVTVKPARRSVGSTTLKVENHLPFTLQSVSVRAGNSAGAPTVPFQAIGLGPVRSALLPIQAATATIDRVELNGL
ncbi:MAG: hypothetical protein ACP5XB_30640 [Isosphaeraceae bacterium]